MRRLLPLALLLLAAGGCASFPEGAYFPRPGDPQTLVLSRALFEAARGADDDPNRYSFAMIHSRLVVALSTDDATFYFSDGLARQSSATIDALVADAVAHEVLGHDGQRRRLTLGLSTGFSILGLTVPGLGLVDFLVSPLIVRAWSREQKLDADRKAIEILRTMGHEGPRRTLAEALVAAAAVNGPSRGGLLADEPDLGERLSALEPLEDVKVTLHPPARPAAPPR